MGPDENVPFVWKSGLPMGAGLTRKDRSVALQEVLDWIGYEQRGIYREMSIL